MEKQREANVWQRVAAPPSQGQSREELRILLQNAAERSALFHNLSGRLARGKDELRLLREMESANIASIKGMLVFSGSEIPGTARTPPPEQPRQSLIRGYYLAKKAAAEYTARSVDPEFGLVYQEMAARETKICSLITQLLGELSF